MLNNDHLINLKRLSLKLGSFSGLKPPFNIFAETHTQKKSKAAILTPEMGKLKEMVMSTEDVSSPHLFFPTSLNVFRPCPRIQTWLYQCGLASRPHANRFSVT